jgi:CMP-N,N'-diacetyllegionaminic acid synthase
MLAIIPARKGSKGLPGKNIKLLNGLPLIIHTINAAKKSKKVSRIIISSDDDKVIELCKNIKGVDIPFKRPQYLAKDRSILTDTLFHLFKWMLKNEGNEPKHFCVLQPTSPLRLAKDIDGAINLFHKEKADAVLSVYETRPLFFNLSKKKQLISITNDISKHMLARQKVKEGVLQNGAVHVFNAKKLKEIKNYYSKKTYGYKMSINRSVDIDTKFDFFMAEQIMKHRLHL